MGKIQTRRSVSLRAEEFVRAQRLAEVLGMSVSAAIEAALQDLASRMNVQSVPRADALAILRGKKPEPEMPDHGAYFTF